MKNSTQSFGKIILTALPLLLSLPLWADEAAARPAPGPLGALMSFFPLIAFALIFYFLLFRPQQNAQKERRKMLEGIKKGDKVLTAGGIYGQVIGVRGDTIDLKLADNLKVEANRSYIARVILSGQSVPSTGNGSPTEHQ